MLRSFERTGRTRTNKYVHYYFRRIYLVYFVEDTLCNISRKYFWRREGGEIAIQVHSKLINFIPNIIYAKHDSIETLL